jgi:hypothetical protein
VSEIKKFSPVAPIGTTAYLSFYGIFLRNWVEKFKNFSCGASIFFGFALPKFFFCVRAWLIVKSNLHKLLLAPPNESDEEEIAADDNDIFS